MVQLHEPADVATADERAELARTANDAHAAGEAESRKGLERFRDAGAALLKAKASKPECGWLKWLKANIKFSRQLAAAYMRVAAGWDKCKTVFHLRDALRLLRNDPAKPPPLDDDSKARIGTTRLRLLRKVEKERLARVKAMPVRLLLADVLGNAKVKTVNHATALILATAAEVEGVRERLGLGKSVAGKVGAVADPDEAKGEAA